jgi:signal transduction histidine kinase/CheY-like chemotaxis protein
VCCQLILNNYMNRHVEREIWQIDSAAELNSQQEVIARFVADNPAQLQNLAELRLLLVRRFDLLTRVIDLYDQQGFAAAREFVAGGHGYQTMHAVRSLTDRMDAAEAKLLTEREANSARIRQLTLISLLVTLAVATSIFTALFRGIRREMMARGEAEQFDAILRRALSLFASTFSRDQTLRGLLDMLAEAYPYSASAFYAYEEWQGLLVREALRGLPADAPEAYRLGEGPVGEAAETGRMVVLSHSGTGALRIDTDMGPVVPATILACPVIHGERRLGVLAIAANGSVSERERAFVERMAGQLSVALNNLKQYSDLKRLSEQLRGKNEEVSQKNLQLEQASRSKSEFLATMSHELRTPLNAIIGFSEVLRDGLVGELSAEQNEYLGDVLASGEHLLALINDILDLSKVEAGKMELNPEPVELRALLSNSLGMVKEKALAHRIRLTLEAEEDLPPVWADARKMKQILYNLLSNAVKFTGEGGAVTLTARRLVEPAGEELEIAVTDTGIGIATKDQVRLFQPFVQIDSSLARNFEGTGLGLAMVKRLAELHGGRVAIASEPGKGSTFTVRLPYRVGEASVVAEPAPKRRPGRAKRLAFVVEDKDDAAELLRLHLESEGLEVIRATDAETGLKLARERSPDVITLDLLLPGMDGWEFLTALKANVSIATIPVMIVSIVADEKKGLALGAAQVLQKPVGRQELTTALADLGLLPSPGRQVTILVVDDDPKAVDILGAFLETAGCRVVRAFGGREGIEQARSLQPDLMILDLMMPEVSGFDVVEALKGDASTRAIPIIVVTAKVVTPADRAVLNRHVVRLLQKTEFRRENFLAEVRRALVGVS